MTPASRVGKTKEWAALETELSFRTSWKCPDRKKALAPEAERAVGIIEVTMKCLLLERDLQHGWWKYCADAAKFLLNRFLVLSQLSTMPKHSFVIQIHVFMYVFIL